MLGNSVDQIARVIADLRPMTALPDDQTTACSLSERMAHFASSCHRRRSHCLGARIRHAHEWPVRAGQS
jgi:hypothetical protein